MPIIDNGDQGLFQEAVSPGNMEGLSRRITKCHGFSRAEEGLVDLRTPGMIAVSSSGLVQLGFEDGSRDNDRNFTVVSKRRG